jgi:type II secretory pathway pseudopilin PulG
MIDRFRHSVGFTIIEFSLVLIMIGILAAVRRYRWQPGVQRLRSH